MNCQKLHTLRGNLHALIPYMEKRLTAGGPQGSGNGCRQCWMTPCVQPQVRGRSARRLEYGDSTWNDSLPQKNQRQRSCPMEDTPLSANAQYYTGQAGCARRLEYGDSTCESIELFDHNETTPEEDLCDYDENGYDTPPELALDEPVMSSTQYQFCDGQQVFNSSLNRRPSFGPQIASSTTYVQSCQPRQPLGRFLSMEYSSDYDETQPGDEQGETSSGEAPIEDICPNQEPSPIKNEPSCFGDACPNEGAAGEPWNNKYECGAQYNDVEFMTPWPNPNEISSYGDACYGQNDSSMFGYTFPNSDGSFGPPRPNQSDFGETLPNQGGATCPNRRGTPLFQAQSPNQGGEPNPSGGQDSVVNLYKILLDRTAEATQVLHTLRSLDSSLEEIFEEMVQHLSVIK